MNSQEEFIPSFKLKRDEYLIEIRKNKSSDYILTKRAKLFSKAFNNEENPKMAFEQIDTSAIVNLCEQFKIHMRDQNLDNLIEVLEKIRTAISHETVKDPPLNELVHSGIVPELIHLIRPEVHHLDKLVFECSWILTGLAAGDSDHTEYLVNEKIIPYCLTLLEHRNYEIVDHAVWILANVTGESLKYRDEALNMGIVNKLDTLLANHVVLAPEYVTQIAWLMSNLCRGQNKKHYPDYSEVVGFTSSIESFLKSKQEEETYQHCMFALFYLTNADDDNSNEEKIDEVLNMDAMPQIINLLRFLDNKDLLIPTLKLLTNISNGTAKQTQAILNNGFLDHVNSLFEHPIFEVRKQTCVLLSNIVSGTSAQIAEVVNYEDAAIIRKIINLVRKDDKEIGEECLCFFANLTQHSSFLETNLLVQNGVIELFVELIEMNINSFITETCLETLQCIIKDGDTMSMDMGTLGNQFLIRFCQLNGMALLEKLQTNKNKSISDTAHDLLATYASYESQF